MFLQISGIEILDRLRPMHYTHADAFLVCFAVDNPESYENLRSKWVPEVRRYRPDAALILVGTKADLRSRSNCLLVTTQEVRTCQSVSITFSLYVM